MKKSIFALVMALVLCLSTCAMAVETPAAFTFTAEEYVEGYTKFNADAMQKEITWSEPVEVEDLVGVLGSAEGMNDVIVYCLKDDPTCAAVYAECIIGMSDEDMTAKAQAFGMTVAAIPYAARYLECDYDITAMSDEITEIEQACTALVQTVFSADAITAAMSEPYSETAVIGGHSAELTLSVNMTDMTMEVSFIYMP